jgi:hypothetical protein
VKKPDEPEDPVIIRVLGRAALVEEFGIKRANEIIAGMGTAKQNKEIATHMREAKTLADLALRLYPLGLFVYDGTKHVIDSGGAAPTVDGFKGEESA